MESLQRGAWDHMIGNVVNFHYGYAQIHQKGYWAEPSIDKAFLLHDELKALPDDVPGIKTILPRIESFALASIGNNTTGALVIGMNPEAEHQMTKLKDKVIAGSYLEDNDEAALLGEGLAKKLSLGVGDTLYLISQGYHGVNAVGKYPVKGIVKLGSPELSKQMIYLPLASAQYFYGAEGLVTTIALNIENPKNITPAIAATTSKLDPATYEVLNWEQLIPDLVKAKELDSGGNIVVYIILYIIVAFGILGTILMMTKERTYEFGVLVSIGMQRLQLAATVWIEIILLGFFGALSGILASIPVVWYFNQNPLRFSGDYSVVLEKFGFEPIFPATFDPTIFVQQAITVIIITSLLGLYPLLKINNLHPVEAMRA